MPNYYSQHGEDILLDLLFADQDNGFFVEIGCIDGKRFSNTLVLEKRGWNGLCIEAHSDYIPLLRLNRPNSLVIHCAVSDRDKDSVIFYANDRGSLSTLNKSQGEKFKKDYGPYFSGFKEQIVQQRTLVTIFGKYQVSKIDFLSIDVEGQESAVVRGMDFMRWQPRVVLIECDSENDEFKLDKLVLKWGYIKSIRLASNLFYVLKSTDHEKLVNQYIKANVNHTKHPLDKNGDHVVEVVIDTR